MFSDLTTLWKYCTPCPGQNCCKLHLYLGFPLFLCFFFLNLLLFHSPICVLFFFNDKCGTIGSVFFFFHPFASAEHVTAWTGMKFRLCHTPLPPLNIATCLPVQTQSLVSSPSLPPWLWKPEELATESRIIAQSTLKIP